MEPVSSGERIHLLDILRGFAIFGMFTVNLTADQPFSDAYWDQTFDGLDRLTLILVDLFSNGRFITIFSFLFGIGFCIQLDRASTRNAPFAPLFIRRLAGLFFISAVTIVAGLYTFILVDYATYGLLLLLFSKRSLPIILVSAILMFAVAKIPGAVESYEIIQVEQTSVGQANGADVQGEADESQEDERAYIHRKATLTEIAAYRVERLGSYLTGVERWVGDLDILAMLLLGFYVGRRRLIYDERARGQFARKVLPWLLSIGAVFVLIFVYIEHGLSSAWDEPPLVTVKWAFGWPLGMVVMGLAYVAAITLLVDRPGWNRILSPLAPVGRLALTNYLLTTLIEGLLWYSWGFDLFDQLRPFHGLLIVVVTFPILILASTWWVKRFRFGPFEWLWRSMTYGKLPPMRIPQKGLN